METQVRQISKSDSSKNQPILNTKMDKQAKEFLEYKDKLSKRNAERKHKAMLLELKKREIDDDIRSLETEQLKEDINFLEYQQKIMETKKAK